MQGNADKCHVLISAEQKALVNIGAAQIEKSNSEKHVRKHIDSKLGFERHMSTTCGNARAKISALGRIAPYKNIEKRKTVKSSFFVSQFNSCPLI